MPVSNTSRAPRLPRLAFLLAACALAGHAVAGPVEDQRAINAVRVLSEIQQIPEQGIPDKLLDEGKAVVVIPDTLKVGLVLGGRRGHGLMSIKSPDGSWSQPVFVKLTGGSIGFQAGVQSSDVVLCSATTGIWKTRQRQGDPGRRCGVAAGPVGRNASASTDGQLKPNLVVVARARPVRGRGAGWCRVADR